MGKKIGDVYRKVGEVRQKDNIWPVVVIVIIILWVIAANSGSAAGL